MTAADPARPAARPDPDRPAARPDPDRLAGLEEERAFLLRSLADLEREHAAGDLDDADYEALRDGYTARAAAVLREIADGRAALAPKRPRRAGRTVAIVVAVVVAAVAAGAAVAAFSGQRLPGDTATGDIADSVNTRLAEARALQGTDPRAAIDRYDEVLALQPDHPEALTYRGWLLVRVGSDALQRGVDDGLLLVERGEASLDQAITVAPGYADPHCFKAITRFRFYDDAAGAKPAVDTCLASNPPSVVRDLVANLQEEVDAALAAG